MLEINRQLIISVTVQAMAPAGEILHCFQVGGSPKIVQPSAQHLGLPGAQAALHSLLAIAERFKFFVLEYYIHYDASIARII